MDSVFVALYPSWIEVEVVGEEVAAGFVEARGCCHKAKSDIQKLLTAAAM